MYLQAPAASRHVYVVAREMSLLKITSSLLLRARNHSYLSTCQVEVVLVSN